MNKKVIHSRSKKRKYSFEQKDTPLKNYVTNRVYFVRKLNSNIKSKEISKEIDDFFGSPDKYFQKNSPVTVGKKIIIFDINDNRPRRKNKLKTEKKNGSNLFNHLQSIASNLGTNPNLNSWLYKTTDKKKGGFNPNFEIIDNDKLKIIFDLYKNKDNQLIKDDSIDKSQSLVSDATYKRKDYINQRKKMYGRNNINYTYNKLSSEKIPEKIKQGLNLQTKKLNLMKSSELKNRKISKYLSRKSNKPQENLLLNRIDSFRFKKEIIKEMEYNKPKEEEFGRYNWNVSLRRPDNFRGIRKAYVNLSEEKYNSLWSLMIEKYPKEKIISIKPEYTLSEGEIHSFKKQTKNLKKIKINDYKNPYFETIENLDNIIVKGKNLFNLEYKREIIDSKNKKIWHKVFLENGKTISLADVNKIYGNETFYKNYDGCATQKNTTSKLSKINFEDFI